VIGFSSFGVLLYYLIANVSAFTQVGVDRSVPRGLQVLGAIGCLLLVATLPTRSIAAGSVVLLIGIAYRGQRLSRLRAGRTSARAEGPRFAGDPALRSAELPKDSGGSSDTS
jgi:APA family basic amino acid/polyamine antiporter